ncbi:hypothetical protein Tco_1118622 [Tanacetum coccineum]
MNVESVFSEPNVIDVDDDTPLKNFVVNPKVKRKLLNSSVKHMLSRQSSPTTYVVNKGKSQVNDNSIQVENIVDKGKSTMNDDAIPVKKVVDKGKSKMIQDDHPVKKPLRKNKGIQTQENVNPSSMDSDIDSKSDLALGICHTLTMAETRECNIMINHNTRYKIEKTTLHKLQLL